MSVSAAPPSANHGKGSSRLNRFRNFQPAQIVPNFNGFTPTIDVKRAFENNTRVPYEPLTRDARPKGGEFPRRA
jgi:hypothetical protein